VKNKEGESMTKDRWKPQVGNLERKMDKLIYLLHIANQPDTPDEIREVIDEVVEDYLIENDTTLDKIRENLEKF
jgi:uncharacterized secreted protein with C-terminal beta-propeller domain